jgi:UDP-glucose 4-epimerase
VTWLVVGGAGYIGAHVVRRLHSEGHMVVVLDDLSTGVPGRIPAGVALVSARTTDHRAVSRALLQHQVTGVINLAARKSVPESVADPLRYYHQNVDGMRVLLQAMVEAGVSRMVLSSSAAVYGIPADTLVREDASTGPINPYGETKLMCEWMLRSAGTAYGISWIALRYFNVVGSAAPSLADVAGDGLFPRIFRDVVAGRPVAVTGVDFATRDGTGVRDYVHVADVAEAHAAAIARLDEAACADVYNVGTGNGHSVLEVLDAVHAVTGMPVEVRALPRRPGDPAEVVAAVEKIGRELAWKARQDLFDMVRSSTWQPAVRRD